METFVPRINQIGHSTGKATAAKSERPRNSLHAKSLVIDGKVAVVCTSNFDPRSAYLNSECAVIIHDPVFAQALEANIRRDMEPRNSWVIAEKKPFPLIGQINYLMATVSGRLPVLDIWPNSHTSCFELKDGKSPVNRTHPEFYKRYKMVGIFPECDASIVGIKTIALKAVFGWATPIM